MLSAEEGDDISGDAFRDERLRMATEIQAAEQSLAETELRLTIETRQLKMALELAQDVAAVYQSADDATRRTLNQAFFTKLYVSPEWDEAQGQTTAQIARAELTPPYALLLADDLVPGVLAEVERITANGSQHQKRLQGANLAPQSLFSVGVHTSTLWRGVRDAFRTERPWTVCWPSCWSRMADRLDDEQLRPSATRAARRFSAPPPP